MPSLSMVAFSGTSPKMVSLLVAQLRHHLLSVRLKPAMLPALHQGSELACHHDSKAMELPLCDMSPHCSLIPQYTQIVTASQCSGSKGVKLQSPSQLFKVLGTDLHNVWRRG